MFAKVRLNEAGLDSAAAGVGIHSREVLTEYLEGPIVEPVTADMIAHVLSHLPVQFDAVFTVC